MSSGTLGKAYLTVTWPQSFRVTPTMQSIKLDILDGASVVASRTVNRIHEEGQVTALFDSLPVGNLLITISAHPEPDGHGATVATASAILSILPGKYTVLAFEVLGEVDLIEVYPLQVSIGVSDSVRLTAMPKNSDGQVVLLDPDALSWTAAEASIAAVENDGMVTGVSPGTAGVHVVESRSGAAGVAWVTVTQALWTVMLYMAADNDLEPHAIKDIDELEIVGSTPQVSVVVQVDRAQGYDRSNGDWTTTRRYYITRDFDPLIINSTLIEDLGELNMADPNTLSDFVNWATREYPAERYLLVLWDHGKGWRTSGMALGRVEREVKAIFIDETFGAEMSLAGLSNAFEQMTEKMDIVLFDACLMGMIEVAYSIRNGADVMIASEENIPVYGQPYNITLGRLASNPAISPQEASRVIVDEYMDYYSNRYAGTFTYSAIYLPSLHNVISAADELAAAILANPAVYPEARLAQQQTQHYDFDKRFYTDYKDLYDFARRLDALVSVPAVNSAASNLMSSIATTVLYERNNGGRVADSHGIAIYLPDSGRMLSKYRNIEFARDTRWADFLTSY